MNTKTWKSNVYTMRALMSDVGPDSTEFDPICTSMRLANRRGFWRAVAWPTLPLPDTSKQVVVCEATVLEVREHPEIEPLALVHWNVLPPTDLFDLIPAALCPIAGVVQQTCDLIKSIHSASLKRLLVSVFSMPDVHFKYWSCPASLNHHHADEGGLAQHSLEVAVATESVRGLDTWQRDLALVYALLHDIGKVWSYTDGRLTNEARRLGHEAIGYRTLQPALETLREGDARAAIMLDALLSGEWKRSFRHPAAALGDIVRAMDRFSAARGVGNALQQTDS